MPWEASAFEEIAAAHEIEVVLPAPDRPPVRVPIWTVTVGGNLYVRSWKGESGLWYRRARQHGTGTIGGHPVRFIPETDPAVDTAIDDAFRAKYGGSPYVTAMIEPPAAGTTLRLEPAA